MAKLIKIVLVIAASIVGIFVVAAIAVGLFFDPNDYRDTIAQTIEEQTGRQLTIDGDISLTVFPWLAVEVGQTTLSNAAGFGDEPMLRFDSARLSVELLPLLFNDTISVGTASLDGLVANLAIQASGRNNWQDISEHMAERAEADGEQPAAEEDSSVSVTVERNFSVDIKDIVLSNASVRYDDAQSGSRYSLADANFRTGAVSIGEPFDIDAAFAFEAAPAGLSGNVEIESAVTVEQGAARFSIRDLGVRSTVAGLVAQPAEIRFDARAVTLDTESETLSPGEMDLNALGLNVTAIVEPINYAASQDISAALRVSDFSLKELLQTLDIEAPETADPNALQKVSFQANAAIGDRAMTLSDLSLVLDDTTLTGSLSVPLNETDALVFDLSADSITLDNYMAPPGDDAASDAEAADVEIPADLVRTLKANGTLRLAEAFLGPVRFTDMQLGVTAADERMRLHPINASFFDGGYSGDVRIDASGQVPRLSVNETITGVDLAAMMNAMYDVQEVTGSVDANVVLEGAGQTMSAITADLDGSMRFELKDGAWQGVDVWHQLRSARALFKREPAPQPRSPVRTEFTSIATTGQVTDGVYSSNDLLAQLPFLRVTGGGTVDLRSRVVDYTVQARVLENPEFANVATEDELADFTQAVIPIRVTGPLASPSFRPDIESIFRQEVERAIEEKKDELKDQLINRLLGGDEEGEQAEESEEERDPEDVLKDRLKELFPR